MDNFTSKDSAGAMHASPEKIKGKVLGDYLIELPVLKEVDYAAIEKKCKETLCAAGCSAICKKLNNGDMVVGRSMDLGYSHNPAYVVKTDTQNGYKTVGFAYNPYFGTTYDEAREIGITQDELTAVLLSTYDVMNEKGLYIELDMRLVQPDWTNIAMTTGTNPDADISLCYPAVLRYFGEKCATVDEVLELAQNVNAYDMVLGDMRWSGAYLVAEASGRHGILEIVDNKFVWTEGAECHANFYINEEYKDRAVFGDGFGRYEVLMGGIADVKTEADMMELIKKVKYSQVEDPDNCIFDPRGETTGYIGNPDDADAYITIEMAKSEKYKEKIMSVLREDGKRLRSLTIDQLRDEPTTWISAWQCVANCNKRTIKVIFFEDDDLTFDFAI